MRAIEDSDELRRQENLLKMVFPRANVNLDYLDWLYRKSPDGWNIASDYTESDRLLGHYAIVPQRWRADEHTNLLALSLNTAVHPDARGKGLFVKLAEETYAIAAQRGIEAVIGVANANSTPGFTGRLGFTLLRPLPVVAGLTVPIRAPSTYSHFVNADFLSSEEFSSLAGCLEPTGKEGITQDWSTEKLRWRLRSPRGRYALHSSSSGLLVTTAVRALGGIRVVVALKFLPNVGCVVDTGKLIRAAAAHHKTPFFVYSGFNSRAPLAGAPLPRRILPSPLNLIYRKLAPSMPEPMRLNFDAFEFLDFDAY